MLMVAELKWLKYGVDINKAACISTYNYADTSINNR